MRDWLLMTFPLGCSVLIMLLVFIFIVMGNFAFGFNQRHGVLPYLRNS